MSRSWIQHDERGTPSALRLILWIALNLGRPVARLFLYPIALYFLLTAGPQRRASVEFLEQLLGTRPTWLTVFRHFHCFASTILDRVFLLSNRFQPFDIRLHEAGVLLDRVEQGQGCILLGAHIGSFEVLRALAVEKELPLKILMYPEHNQVLTELLLDLNPDLQDSIIPLGEVFSLVTVNDILTGGGLVGMLGDRVAESEKVVRCNFLGRTANFPAGPFMLAAATGVPVVLFAGLYKGGNRYDVHFELLGERIELSREKREKDAQVWCSRYVARLEDYVREAPYNWFNFYGFWDEV